jgi:hypothetical protein
MWDFLFGYLFGRATGVSRVLRPFLLLLLVGLVIVSFVYAGIVFSSLAERNRTPHVQHNSSH